MTTLAASRTLRPRPATLAHADDAWPHTARVMPWALAGFVSMTWLLPFNAVAVGPLPMDRSVLAGVALLWMLALADRTGAHRPRVVVGKVHAAVLAFAVVALVSLLVNIGLLTNLGELHLATKKYLTLVFEIGFFVIAASVIRREEIGRFAMLMVGLAAVSAAAAVVEYRTDFNVFYDTLGWLPGLTVPPDLSGFDYVGRRTTYGPTDTPLELSTQLAMALPFAVVGVLAATDRTRRRRAAVATALIVAGIFATERKTGIIGVVAGGVVLLAYRPSFAKPALKLGLVLVLALHVLAPGAMGSLRQQLSPDHLFGTLSNRDRASDYSAVAPDILTHPVLGRGYASYEPYKYRILDNEWLGLVVQVGIVGVAAFAALLLTALATAHGTIRSRAPGSSEIALACACTVAGFAVGAALFDVLAFPHVMYTLFFVLALLAVLRAPDPASSSGRARAARA